MRVDYGVGRSRGWRVDHDALCSLRPVKLFIVPRTLSRALARVLALLSVALSRPLCPFVLSSPRLSVLSPRRLLPRPIIIAVSLSLPSIPRFFPMATSSLKAASSTSRSAGIQPSMRGRVVPSCREHAALSSSCKMCACAAFIPLALIRPSLSFADSC